ncbi:hydroxymethylbilane synthase [Alkalibaculum bacchi]|uniref:hydroxymethylbilane synthase n=1 Tax=Alkalibaculum bacchi TaxID=645887 RepID=UPI0026EA2E28|nr:hydroxymethylbilane synthase [Alkalibaculum bacchi]
MKIIVGTRGSNLALTQTKWVVSQLQNNYPDTTFEIKTITTTGDRIQNVSLDKIGEKGVFVKEIEEQLLSGQIDLAVHSMKDMPGELPEGLMFSWVPKREDYRDVIVLKEGYKSFDDLPQGAVIGTGSKRRQFQLSKYRQDLKFDSIRGNIETRVRKIEDQNLHGVVLAAAGLRRIGLYEKLRNRIEPIEPHIILPSPAQGILAIEIRKENTQIHKMIESINHSESFLQATAERSFLKGLNGNCHIPMGALCTIKGENIEIEGLLGNEDGSALIKRKAFGPKEDAEKLGWELAKDILEEMKGYEG